MKKITVALFSILLGFYGFAQNVTNIQITNFKADGNTIINEQLKKFPITVNCNVKKENTGLIITGEFETPQNLTTDLGLILYKNLMSCKIYVNGQLLDTIGRSGKNFFFQPYITRGVIIPRSILQDVNTIKFELWNDTGNYKIRLLKITDKDSYDKLMKHYSFNDIQIPRFACILLIFVAIYSFFMFINYQGKRTFLFLALSALSFAGYLLNVTIYDSTISYLFVKASLYSLFPLSVLFLLHFFQKFFDIKIKKQFRIAIDVVGIIFFLGYYLQRNTVSLDSWHSVMLVYPFFALGFGVFGVIKSSKYKGKRNIATTLGLIVALVFSAYDMYNFMLNITPFILLQGPGFMGLIIGTFYSISQELAVTNTKCVKFAKDLKENQEKQIKIFSHVKDVSEKVNSAGTNLDSSIESVSSLMTQYFSNAQQIHTNILTQHEQMQQNKENVSKIFSAIEKMSGMVSKHETLVEETVADINGLTDGINKTDELIKQSSETINVLTNVCMEADKDVSESSSLVDDLANYSKNIYAIVKSISDISEQTNVLSINAAIEAARTGEAGKGFSVVASEIRSLASESSKNTDKINDILSTMVSKISNIQNQEALVSSRLKKVVKENSKTQQEINDVFSVLQFQLEKSNRISSMIKDLVETVHIISEQTLEQRTSSEDLSKSLNVLTEITDSVLAASQEQQDCNNELKANLNTIQSVSDENVNINNELKQIVEK